MKRYWTSLLSDWTKPIAKRVSCSTDFHGLFPRPRHSIICEDLLYGYAGQNGARQSDAGGSDHQHPSGGGVVQRHRLDHVHQGYGIDLGPSKLNREFQGHESGIVQCIDGRWRERAFSFSLFCSGSYDLASTLHRIQQNTTFILTA